MIKYEIDETYLKIIKCLINELDLNYIDSQKIFVVRSYKSKAKAYARIYSLPSIIRFSLKLEPVYVIEIISEKFDKLNQEQKIKVLIHELLHIPYNFSGGLRPHGKYVNEKVVNKLFNKINYKKCIY